MRASPPVLERSCLARLELNLQRPLEVPLRVRAKVSRRADHTQVAVGNESACAVKVPNRGIGITEIYMIEEVDRLHTKLGFGSFSDLELFEK